MAQNQMDQAQSMQPWELQVTAARAEGTYDQAALLCEQQIEVAPEEWRAYWHLGLIRLLQEQEAEAQLTWMTVLAEAPPEAEATWISELLAVVETAVQEQIDIGNLKLAWTLRQYIKEFAPTDIENLLKLVQLSIQIEQFLAEDLNTLGILELLHQSAGDNPETISTDVPPELLLETVKQLPDATLGEAEILEFIEACLPFSKKHSGNWLAVFLEKASRLGRFWKNTGLACRYAEWGLQIDEDHPAMLQFLIGTYYRLQKYEQGIQLAQHYSDTNETFEQQVIAHNLLINGYLPKGLLWDEAAALLEEQTNLLHRWMNEFHGNGQGFPGASTLCNAMFAYPYFYDRPTEVRSLQNQISRWFQEQFQAAVDTLDFDYKPCSRKTVNLPRKRSKIRIGYLSRSMDRHSVGWLCRWLFHHHDRERFEIYAYFNHMLNVEDFSRQWFVNNAHRACTFEGDDLGIARDIQTHEIDILVDLDSLTDSSNYSVLALKPAPVQVTWLGLDATGLPAVDYFIVDPYVVPENAQDYYSEKLWYMPQTYLAVDGFEVWMPTLRRSDLNIPEDAVIYFSAQQAFKRHPDMVRLQLQIVREVPNSYLLIKGVGDKEGIQTLFYQMADEVGVSQDRLRFLGRDPCEEVHRANLGIADVVLDTFPYNGATHTMETLWVGTPLVTKVGQQFAARNSYTMLVNAGISEGIAWSDEEYLDWGIRLGKDADLRDHVRWKLHQSRRTAPLWDGKTFTRQMEDAYSQMWAIYCEGGES